MDQGDESLVALNESKPASPPQHAVVPRVGGEQNDGRDNDSYSSHSENGTPRRTHQRSTTAVKVVDYKKLPINSLEAQPALPEEPATESDAAQAGHLNGNHDSETQQEVERSQREPTPERETSESKVIPSSEPSVESNELAPLLSSAKYSPPGTQSVEDDDSTKRLINHPDALSYLDPDSPDVTQESIYQSIETAAKRSSPFFNGTFGPAGSSSSSSASGLHRKVLSNEKMQPPGWSMSPEHSPKTYNSEWAFPKSAFPTTSPQRRRRSTLTRPQYPPSASTPRANDRGAQFPRQMRRTEPLPQSGYDLLASQLTAQSSGRAGPSIRPMYRRFEALNHRLLLQLQDELCELEEQLCGLDAADTQSRWVQDVQDQGEYILPASRRAENMSGDGLGWTRTDILGRIGFKLEQYNRILSSFRGTSSLPAPSLADVHEYRGFLATHGPVADVETHFLDATDDLVCLDDGDDGVAGSEMNEVDYGEVATPMPRRSIVESGKELGLATEGMENAAAFESSRSSSPTMPGFDPSLPGMPYPYLDKGSSDNPSFALPAGPSWTTQQRLFLYPTILAVATVIIVPAVAFAYLGHLGQHDHDV